MTPPLPAGPYQVILSDPPWRYNARRNPRARFGLGAGGHYPTMPTEAIAALPVRELAAPDALLYLWATGPRMPDALRVLGGWGFTFATVAFVWIKTSRAGRPLIRPGSYTGSNAEFVLVGRRGRQLRPAVSLVPSVVTTTPGRHSVKPAEVAERIERMHPGLARIELFARGEGRPGWDVWGLEAGPAAAEERAA